MLDKHKPFRCETCFWFELEAFSTGGRCHRLCKQSVMYNGRRHWKHPLMRGSEDFCGEHQDGPPTMFVNTLTNVSTGEVHTMRGPVVTTKPTPPDNDDWNVMKKCPDGFPDAGGCQSLKPDNRCGHRIVPLQDKMPDNLPQCFFRKGDE